MVFVSTHIILNYNLKMCVTYEKSDTLDENHL